MFALQATEEVMAKKTKKTAKTSKKKLPERSVKLKPAPRIAKKKAKQVQHCGFCAKTKHNARTCPDRR